MPISPYKIKEEACYTTTTTEDTDDSVRITRCVNLEKKQSVMGKSLSHGRSDEMMTDRYMCIDDGEGS